MKVEVDVAYANCCAFVRVLRFTLKLRLLSLCDNLSRGSLISMNFSLNILIYLYLASQFHPKDLRGPGNKEDMRSLDP